MWYVSLAVLHLLHPPLLFDTPILWGELRPNIGASFYKTTMSLGFCCLKARLDFKWSTDFNSVSCLKLCCLLSILVETHCLALDLVLSSSYFKTPLGERDRQKIEIISVSFVLSHNYFGNFQYLQTSFWNFIWFYSLFVVRNIS